MRNNLNFNHLECFYYLVNTLSFSKVSQKLKIAQPVVSKQIQALEDYFKTQLFIRSKQKVVVTERGREIYEQTFPHYQNILRNADQFVSESGRMEGNVVFGCLSEVGKNFFLKPLVRYKSKNPFTKVHMKFLKGLEIVEGVKNGSIDIGIVADSILSENIRSYKVLEEEIVLVGHTKYIKTKPKSLGELNFVGYRENDPLLELYLKKCYPRMKRNKVSIEFSVNSHQSMVEVLESGPFYAVLPKMSVASELKNKSLVDIGPKSLKSFLYLIYSDLKYVDEKIQTMVDEIKLYVQEKSS